MPDSSDRPQPADREGPRLPVFVALALVSLFSVVALGWCLWRFGPQLSLTSTARTIDPAVGLVGAERQRASADAMGLPVFCRNRLGMEFAWCPPGEFDMGTPDSDPLYRRHEHPHRVRLTRGFYLSRYEVTQAHFQQLMNGNVEEILPAGLPAGNVTWNEASEFCVRLTQQDPVSGYEYRLPTEAEWEYACRADTKTTWHHGTDIKELSRYGWVRSGPRVELQLVGQLLPNAWGLFDMHGNVWEWCQDHFDVYPVDELTIDPSVSQIGRDRVRRGGSVGRYAIEATSSGRNALKPTQRDPHTGFRIVLAMLPPAKDGAPAENGP